MCLRKRSAATTRPARSFGIRRIASCSASSRSSGSGGFSRGRQRLLVGVLLDARDEAFDPLPVVARLRRHPHADRVGLDLVFAAQPHEQRVGADPDRLLQVRLARDVDPLGGLPDAELGARAVLDLLDDVPLVHVDELVGQDPREHRLVLHERQRATGHEHVAAGGGEGVHLVAFEDGETVDDVGARIDGGDDVPDQAQVVRQRRVARDG